MFKEYFDTLLWGRLCIGMEKYTPNRARFFLAQEIYNFLALNES
jgi:hypothetical protein